MSNKQIGQRYRVRQDPYYYGFWCVIDRYLWTVFLSEWRIRRLKIGDKIMHFRDFDDALQFVKLLEISNNCNEE